MRWALALLLLSSCATQVALSRDQLWAVAGLPSSGRRTLYTDHGAFTFDGDLKVKVVTKDGPLPVAPLKALHRAGDSLVVQPPEGGAVEVQRLDIVRGDASTFSAGRTIDLATAIAGGLAFVYVVIIGLAL
ncbi:MAG TPA: hypothetical protein VMB50_03605 [Myxococcales bacterium]|nr:hypothetical protein [Myxococcales bacterium]